MILERDNDITVQSNIGGEKIDMGLDMSSLVHLMGVLTNLYSDPIKALIREYSTNGRDAHIEAGNLSPIRVTLPSLLEPTLRIKDFGIGMNKQDIAQTYSRYGASTKRETNEQNGVLGLGCKSALTYTGVFTLIADKDGVRTIVSIGRDEDGAGSMTVVDELPTTEPNGVEVAINIEEDDIAEVEATAKHFFSFWDPSTVLVNDEAPEGHNGLRLTDDLFVIDGSQDYLVMGNVAYPTDFNVHLVNNHSLVAYVPLGAVSFTPSREALNYTERTKGVVASIKAGAEAAIKDAVQASIDEAATSQEAVKVMLEWQYALPAQTISTMDFTFQGTPIPSEFALANNERYTVVGQSESKLSGHSRMASITMGSWHKALWIENYDRATFTAGQRKKLNKWSEMKGQTPQRFVLVPGNVDTRWIADDQIIPWEEVAAIKIPRSNNGGSYGTMKSIPGSYEAWQDGDKVYELAADDIDTNNPLFYYNGKAEDAARYMRVIKSNHDEFTLVTMANNRIKKFLRHFPEAKLVKPEVERLYKEWMRKLPGVTKYDLAMEAADVHDELKALDHKQILDPRLRTAARRANRDLTNVKEERRMYMNALGLCYYNYPGKHWADRRDPLLKKWENPLEPYPLYDLSTFNENPKHIYLYLNAIYAATKGA